MALFSLVPLTVTNYVGYTTSRRNLRETSLRSVESAATVAAVRSQLFMEDRRDLVSSLVAGNRDLKTPSRRLASKGRDATRARSRLSRHLRAKLEEADHAVGMFVVTERGDRIGAFSANETGIAERAETACRDLEGRRSRTDFVTVSKTPHLLVRQPVLPSREAPDPGLCSLFQFPVQADARDLDSKLPGSTFRLVGPSGTVVAGQTRGSHEHATQRLPPRLEKRIGSAELWRGSYRTAEGEIHYGALVPVEDTQLSLLADVPEATVMAPLQRLRNRALMLGAAFAAFVMAGIGYTVRRFVGPISGLLDAIRRMEKGELEQSVEPRGPKDIAVLTSHFNRMSARVAELQGNLEKRVRERTTSLRRSEAFNEALIDSIDDNLVVVDNQRTITKANASALDTYGAEIVGEPYFSVFGDDEPQSDSPVERTLETGVKAEAERVHRPKGRTEIVEVQTFPLPGRSDAGDEPALLVVSRPVTEQKHRQAQLIHSEKMAAYGLLAAGYAHEIGNPVASIKSQLRRARTRDDEEEVEETLEVVESQIDRIEGLLRQMSGVARRQDREQRRVSVNQVVEDAVQLLRHDPGSRNVEFVLDLDDSAPAVQADEDRVLQVLLNLGMNATDALENRGRVHLHTSRKDESVRLRVRDTGPGISPEVRERMFEPHFTTKPAGEGTGLGLFVSSRIVEELDGTLRHVETDEEGALFEVVLPAWESD